MTINRAKGKIEMECNSCKDTSEVFNEDDFYVMIEKAKSDGWWMKKLPNGIWEHTCPDCVAKR